MLTACSGGTGIHLCGSTAVAFNKPIAKARGEVDRAIRASAISDDNLRFGRAVAQVLKKWSYQRRLIEDRNNDGQLRSNVFLGIARQVAVTRSHLC